MESNMGRDSEELTYALLRNGYSAVVLGLFGA